MVVQLYGLFKLLTVAPSPNTTRPSFFDISGHTKWDAWKLASETYEGRPSEAERRYLDIARDLGWKEEGAPAAVTGETAVAEERVGGGSGMGVSVSVMSSPPEEDEDEGASGLHAYAMRDDVAAMSAFLQAGGEEGGLDIDARDEYVSKRLLRRALCQPKPHFCRDTPHCIWLQIEGTSPQSSFYSNTAPIKHSK
jgi:acyl-CoA-binding protein